VSDVPELDGFESALVVVMFKEHTFNRVAVFSGNQDELFSALDAVSIPDRVKESSNNDMSLFVVVFRDTEFAERGRNYSYYAVGSFNSDNSVDASSGFNKESEVVELAINAVESVNSESVAFIVVGDGLEE